MAKLMLVDQESIGESWIENCRNLRRASPDFAHPSRSQAYPNDDFEREDSMFLSLDLHLRCLVEEG